jgi:hypothetical protein
LISSNFFLTVFEIEKVLQLIRDIFHRLGPAGSFLTQLATWDCQELEKKLAQRVQTSQRAVHKVLQAFDHMLQRQERLSAAIKDLTSSSS